MGTDKRLYVTVSEDGYFTGAIQAGMWVSVSCTIDPIQKELEAALFP